MEFRAGTRLRSAVCETNVIVVKPPQRVGELRCGGAPMIALKETPQENVAISEGASSGTLLGKRYVCDHVGLEVLCTKSGAGSLEFDDAPLVIQGAKPLPASD